MKSMHKMIDFMSMVLIRVDSRLFAPEFMETKIKTSIILKKVHKILQKIDFLSNGLTECNFLISYRSKFISNISSKLKYIVRKPNQSIGVLHKKNFFQMHRELKID